MEQELRFCANYRKLREFTFKSIQDTERTDLILENVTARMDRFDWIAICIR